MTRKITDEEKRLWKLATREVKSGEPEIDDFLHEAAKTQIRITPVEEIFDCSEGSAAGATSEQRRMRRADGSRPKKPSPLVAGKVNAMDGGSFRRLLQGRQKIEGKLDLHGMWVSDAQIAVRDFIELSHSAGKRCVMIITGKGGITGQGKIRGEFGKWLNDPDIRRMILSFAQSRPEHGGAGAFYVYLRK